MRDDANTWCNENEVWNNLYAKRSKAKQIKPKLKVGESDSTRRLEPSRKVINPDGP